MKPESRSLSAGRSQTWKAASVLGASAMVLGSMTIGAGTAVASPLPAKQSPIQQTSITALLSGAPESVPTGDVTESTVEFIEAPIEDSYTDKGAVSQSVGNEQQAKIALQAIPSGIEADQVPSDLDLAHVVRIDLPSDIVIVGVTWEQGENAPHSVHSRYLQDETWSAWNELEIEDQGADASEGRNGTEPLSLTNATAVEVVARTEDGTSVPGLALSVIDVRAMAPVENELAGLAEEEAAEEPSTETDLPSQEVAPSPEPEPEPESGVSDSDSLEEELEEKAVETEEDSLPDDVLIDLEGSVEGENALFDASSVLGSLFPSSLNSAGTQYATGLDGLMINTRKAWGANESLMKWKPETKQVKGAVIHHTAGNNNYTQAQVAGQIQGVYYYHAVTLGWGDIGYNLIVDKYGGVWEGRSGGLTKAIQGAHAYGSNSETFGISVLGDYMWSAPPQVAQTALAKAIAWKLKVHGVTNALGTISVPGADYRGRTVNTVSAHRDIGWTTCPGDAFYARMGTIRADVSKWMNSQVAPQPTPDPTPAVPVKWSAPVQIGHGWSSRTVFPGDWNGDSKSDLMLITTTGDLLFYPGNAFGGVSAPVQIGRGWSGMNWIDGGVDWNGDGNIDLIARQAQTGKLFVYYGNGKGAFNGSAQIGNGWSSFSRLAFAKVGGVPAIYGISGDTLYFYPGTGTGQFAAPQHLGTGWSAMTAIVSIGDWNSDGIADVLARDSSGDLYLYPGRSNGKFGTRQKIGNGWSGMQVMGASDMTSNKTPLWAVSSTGSLLSYKVS